MVLSTVLILDRKAGVQNLEIKADDLFMILNVLRGAILFLTEDAEMLSRPRLWNLIHLSSIQEYVLQNLNIIKGLL